MNLIELNNVSKRLSQSFGLDGISMTIKQGEFVILKGKNGSGKSTLLNMIFGLDRPDSGEVKLDGRSPQDPKSKNRVGAVLQTVTPPKDIKVKEFVELWRSYYPKPLSTEEILHAVDLKGKHDYFFDKLSGGEKQRLYFALAIADLPKLLIVDEPTKELDAEGKQDFWEQITRCREQGITILMVTNESSDREKIEALTTRCITLEWNKEDGKSKIVADEIVGNITSSANQEEYSTDEPQNFIPMLLRQTWAESLKLFRNPIYLLGILLLPCMVVFLTPDENKVNIQLLFFAGISLLTFAIERIGSTVANERSEGWLKLLRISPLPPTVYLAAKILISLAILIVNLLLILYLGAWRIGVQADGRWVTIFSSLILGVIPFIILGLALGYLFKPKSVNVITGLSIPFALFTCGLPLPAPKSVQDLIPFSPFYHYGQLVLWSAGMEYDNYLLLHMFWLVWAGCIFGFLAVWAYQRDEVVQR